MGGTRPSPPPSTVHSSQPSAGTALGWGLWVSKPSSAWQGLQPETEASVEAERAAPKGNETLCRSAERLGWGCPKETDFTPGMWPGLGRGLSHGPRSLLSMTIIAHLAADPDESPASPVREEELSTFEPVMPPEPHTRSPRPHLPAAGTSGPACGAAGCCLRLQQHGCPRPTGAESRASRAAGGTHNLCNSDLQTPGLPLRCEREEGREGGACFS